MTANTITLTNPWSGAVVERDANDYTQADVDAFANLLTEEDLYALESAESPAQWIRALSDLFGPDKAGHILLGS